MGNASVAGFFQSEANEQGKSANIWRRVGVGVLAILVLAAIINYSWLTPRQAWNIRRAACR